MKACNDNFNEIDQYNFVGGINAKNNDGGSRNQFYWMNSGKKVKYQLLFGAGGSFSYFGMNVCLSISKRESKISFNVASCDELKTRFICQKLR